MVIENPRLFDYRPTMNEDAKLKAAKLAYNQAQREFSTNPTPETKKAFSEASATLSLAHYHANKGKPQEEGGGWGKKKKGGLFEHLPPETAAILDTLRQDQNAAYRDLYADPSAEKRAIWLAATNAYSTMRRKLDPEYAAKVLASSNKSAAKKAAQKKSK